MYNIDRRIHNVSWTQDIEIWNIDLFMLMFIYYIISVPGFIKFFQGLFDSLDVLDDFLQKSG